MAVPMIRPSGSLAAAAALLALAAPVSAQDLSSLGAISTEGTAFEGDWLSVGIGLGVGPSYDGSDDYVLLPVPLVQGSLGGIGINPRPAGLALDFLPGNGGGADFSFGPAARLRSSRASNIQDPVVESLGKLDRAVEIGPSAGVAFSKILHDYDSLSVSLDLRWDIAGAHGGMVANPSVTYFTPLSRGAAVSLTLDADRADDDFMDYYFSVSPEDAQASGLSPFAAKGGWSRLGGFLIGGVDFNGDLTDGGLAAFAIVSYSRLTGDAAASPFTSERGSADQVIGSIGLGYTF